jgi:hypothetical protein
MRSAWEIFALFAASKVGRSETVSWKRRREAREVSMKITRKFCLPVLLFVVTIGAASARAQQNGEGKLVSPSPPTVVQPSQVPSPLPARPVADKLAPAGWMRYEVGEPTQFSLILPAEPVATTARVKIIPGEWGISRSYLSLADSGVYAVSYVDALPAALQDEARKRTFFEGFGKEFAEAFQARMKERGMEVRLTMLEQRTATVGGLAGYEQDFSYGQVMGRVRMVFGAGSAYAVMAIWNGLSSNSERNAFFESLKVNAKR